MHSYMEDNYIPKICRTSPDPTPKMGKDISAFVLCQQNTRDYILYSTVHLMPYVCRMVVA